MKTKRFDDLVFEYLDILRILDVSDSLEDFYDKFYKHGLVYGFVFDYDVFQFDSFDDLYFDLLDVLAYNVENFNDWCFYCDDVNVELKDEFLSLIKNMEVKK